MAFKKNREMKVYGSTGAGNIMVPQIRLQGKWLQELGFDIGEPLNVECEGGRLVITLRDEVIDEGVAYHQ
ncbi:SymE family type I addiction module toxin [Streptococcus cristatus]|jgi:hypothetical protein|uniref:Type I addiction module toxin, SymE family n=2 Tax=Streptococcus TaxID=1301 RepID=A0A4Q2FT12_STROR|nr:SymE family type I addiction module toxin [Streptococcus sp. SC1]MDL2433292.1 SymE family type I addiction module toxin [Streptococcus sp. SC1]RXX22456.1 type I addiction module toxin, SymE family [Streptococcus oralis]